MEKLIHEDSHKGPRHRYGFQFRPVGMFHQPDGWIIGSQRPHPQYRPHGTLDCPSGLLIARCATTNSSMSGRLSKRCRGLMPPPHSRRFRQWEIQN